MLFIIGIGCVFYINSNNDVERIQKLSSFDITAISYLDLMPSVSESMKHVKAYFSFSLSGIDKEKFLNDYEIESIKLNDINIENTDILYEFDNGFRFYSSNYKEENNEISIIIKNIKTGEKYLKTINVSTQRVY